MLFWRKGGLWLELKKSPADERPIGEVKALQKYYLPLRQYVGALPVPCIEAGEHVLMGQPVATVTGDTSCPLHSPASGIVESIDEYDHPVGGKSMMIVINSDGRDTPYSKSAKQQSLKALNPADIINAVKSAGIVSAGGASLPLYRKLREMSDKKVMTIVLNAVETEPYICSSQKLIDEKPDEIAGGLKIAMKCAGASKAVLAVSDDVPHDIVHGMEESSRLEGIDLEVAHIPQKYPSGSELYLSRELSEHADSIGFIYAQDCDLLRTAVFEGGPQTKIVVTVAGDAVKNPQNFEVRIGTTVRDLLDICGLSFDPDRVVLGSAMRGVAVTDLSIPITKSVGAVLALKAARGGLAKSTCINCGRCVSVCPQGLLPNYIAMRAVKADFEALRGLHIADCIECGSCAYICPGRMPIVELVKNIKKAAL